MIKNKKLGKLCAEYAENNNKQAVLAEIRRLKNRYNPFKTASVKPVPFAGTFRGEEEEIISHAVEVAVEEFFTQTITFTVND